MSKHIVVAGCSFTANDESWSSNLKKYFDDGSYHNVALPGMGNYAISCLCIDKVQELIESSVSNKDMFVIVQWSGISRKSFIGESANALSVDFKKCKSKTRLSDIQSESRFLHDCGSRNDINFWNDYKNKYWNDEFSFIETLENILRVQWFLKSNDIEFLMFTGWDDFTLASGDAVHKNWICRAGDGLGQWDDNRAYKNIDNPLLKDVYPWSKNLWSMLDLDRFVFFNSDTVKYGGLLQWVQGNMSKKHWYISKNDKHPSKMGQEMFFKTNIEPTVKEFINRS